MQFFRIFLLSFLLNIYSCDDSGSQTTLPEPEETDTQLNVTFELISDEFDNPWGMAFLPNGNILVTEKSGTIKRVSEDEVVDNDISGGPEVRVMGQGGLLDIELHPQFESNSWVYFTYASDDGSGSGAMTALSRAQWNGSSFDNHQVLYKGSPNTSRGQHFGSRIAFDDQGYVYFSIGDRGSREVNPQDLTRDGGKIYRLHDDGRIPTNNPFVNVAGAKTAVYSYGHRNPQGLATRPSNGQIWSHEHGPQGGDEVNLIEAGKNYGWPEITYGVNYGGSPITNETARAGMEQPIIHWTPSIAPCGMAFVENSRYNGWDGNFIVGSLKFNYLVRCVLEGDRVVEQQIIANGIGRVRNVEMGNDGYLYVGIEGKGLYRLLPR